MNASVQFSIVFLLCAVLASATTINVANSAQLQQACESASPGDTIILGAGKKSATSPSLESLGAVFHWLFCELLISEI